VTVIRNALLSDTMTKAKIVQWHKKVGDKVKSDDNLPWKPIKQPWKWYYADGTLLYTGVKEGDAAKVNDVIAILASRNGRHRTGGKSQKRTSVQHLRPGGASVSPRLQRQQQPNLPHIPESAATDGSASPLPKWHRKGIDIRLVKGSGDEGRITKKN
jgi:pyruvate dehydrogenase E2 component (dihydrolipoamide acetyltransferase)